MATFGGTNRTRNVALLLVLSGFAAVLTSCEYSDDKPDGPARSQASRAPLPAEPTDPGRAEVVARNQKLLDSRLGPRPGGVVLGGSGGLSGDGFRTSAAGIPEGTYTVTAACVGVTAATLSITQPNRRGGTTQELALDCQKAKTMELELETGPVHSHAFRMTTGPGAAALAGFWLVPAK